MRQFIGKHLLYLIMVAAWTGCWSHSTRTGRLRLDVRFTTEVKYVCLLHTAKTDPATHPAYVMGTEDILPRA
jgi:hypothetical protein